MFIHNGARGCSFYYTCVVHFRLTRIIAELPSALQIRCGLCFPEQEQPARRIPGARGTGRGLYYAQENADEEIPLRHHGIFGPKLLGRLPQPRCGPQICEQEHHHSAVQLQSSSILASKFHGWVHMEFTVRRGQKYVPGNLGHDANIDVISFASRRDVVGDFEYLQRGRTRGVV